MSAVKANEDSKVVFFDDDFELYKLTRTFLQIPFEYGGMGGIIGKHYEATKDFLSWNNFEESEFTPLILQMGRIWAGEVSRKK